MRCAPVRAERAQIERYARSYRASSHPRISLSSQPRKLVAGSQAEPGPGSGEEPCAALGCLGAVADQHDDVAGDAAQDADSAVGRSNYCQDVYPDHRSVASSHSMSIVRSYEEQVRRADLLDLSAGDVDTSRIIRAALDQIGALVRPGTVSADLLSTTATDLRIIEVKGEGQLGAHRTARAGAGHANRRGRTRLALRCVEHHATQALPVVAPSGSSEAWLGEG